MTIRFVLVLLVIKKNSIHKRWNTEKKHEISILMFAREPDFKAKAKINSRPVFVKNVLRQIPTAVIYCPLTKRCSSTINFPSHCSYSTYNRTGAYYTLMGVNFLIIITRTLCRFIVIKSIRASRDKSFSSGLGDE